MNKAGMTTGSNRVHCVVCGTSTGGTEGVEGAAVSKTRRLAMYPSIKKTQHHIATST